MFKEIIDKQRNYFNLGNTLDVCNRIDILKKLKKSIQENEQLIMDSLYSDLNKSNVESYTTEISIVYNELDYIIKNIKRLSKIKKVKTSIVHFPSKSFYKYEPLGVVLIISTWNYPFQLSLVPLISAIASGNTVVLKTSEIASNSEKVLENIISSFDEGLICLIKGSEETNKEILNYKFDHIFFTGSSKIGKIVYEKASVNLTPVTLELGGKCPCIIDGSFDIKLACKRIVFGKLINAGQTCVAPDYLLVSETYKDDVVKYINYYKELFYNDCLNNIEYPKIINDKHHNRLVNLINNSNVLSGGNYNSEKIELTLLASNFNDEVMKEEIFGPILPIICYKNINDIIIKLKTLDKPLALYLFSNNKANINKVLNEVSYGGGCINDTIIHLANSNLSFGGVGNSGFGSYHTESGFITFSHKKSILKKGKIDINIRYAPFKNKLKLIKKIL